jgi:hypothetical protein
MSSENETQLVEEVEKAETESALVESSSEEIVVADGEEPVAPETTAPKKGTGRLPVIAGAAVAVVAIVAVVLSMTVFSPQTKADKLYEQGSYAEALEAYTAIGDEDKNGAKMSDCRYWMFVNWLLAEGPYKTSEGDNTWTVEGFTNGDIKVSLSGSVSGSTYAGMDDSWVIAIHHGQTSAEFSASCKVKLLSKISNETGSGKIDLPSYTYGKVVTLDDYEASGNFAGSSFIRSNSGAVSMMIQKGLVGALTSSGTGTTLSDLGFTGLQ